MQQTIPSWMDFARPLLKAGRSMNEATVAYFEAYFPDSAAESRLIADEAIARAERIPPLPAEVEFPDDLSAGAQLVIAMIEQRLLV